MKKRILAAVLSAMMLFTSVNIEIFAMDQNSMDEQRVEENLENGEREEYVYVNPLYEDVITPEIESYVPEERVSDDAVLQEEICVTFEEAVDQLRESYVNREAQTIIYYEAGETDVVEESEWMINSALQHTGNPKEGDYLLFQFGYSSVNVENVGEEVPLFKLTFTNSYYTTSEQEAMVDTEIANVIDSLRLDEKNDVQKIKAVYDYICRTVRYDYTHMPYPSYTLQYTAYAALIDKTAVCQGYAVLLYRMLLELGIDSRVIAGISGTIGHGWNIVRLGGVYYNMDATWDSESTVYSYFMKSDADFEDHYRNPGYMTEMFYQMYPMSLESYNFEIPDDEKPFEITENGFTYEIYYGEASLVKYSGTAKKVVVPSTVQGYPVKRIKSQAFSYLKTMKSLVLSEGIKILEPESILWCYQLESVSYPSTVILDDQGTSGISVVPLYCEKLAKVQVAENHPTIVVYDGAVYDRAMTKLIYYPSGDKRTVLKIPEGVTSIRNDACASNNYLQKVIMPDSVNYIGYWAFDGDSALEEINISKNCQFIGQYAFNYTSIKELYLPATLEIFVVGDVIMPDLEKIEVDSKNSVYYSKQDVLYLENTLVKYPSQKKAKTFKVPDGITEISVGAFADATNLTQINLPDSLQYIGDSAFARAENLNEVTIPESVSYLGQYSFYTNYVNIVPLSMYIPASVTGIQDNMCLDNAIIYGAAGSEAEAYAIKHGNTFVKTQGPYGLPFLDIDANKWYCSSVKWAYESGLLTGTSSTEFDPNGQMTRGMLVTVLYRKEGRPSVKKTNSFSDVDAKKYYASAITWASANKLVSGYTNGNFGPEDSITREQIAKILYLYADYKGFDTTNSADISSYKDAAKVSGYAKKYMQWAVAEGLIKGSNGELNPKGNATRAEISAILKRFVEKYEVAVK